MKQFISIAEAAEILGVSTKTIRRHISAGGIPAFRVGRLIRIRASDIDAIGSPIPSARTVGAR